MRSVECTLLSTTIKQDSIGNEIEEENKRLIPIIKVEDVYAEEYYKARQQGFKPSLRLRISALNYKDEEELIYMGKVYSIIRAQEVEADEIALICGRKIKNVKSS